jgi:hypothetical protein
MYCKIFGYSHVCTLKCSQHILRYHLFIQNDSYNILTFGPFMQNMLCDTSTVTSSSPQTGMQVIKITVVILSNIKICYPSMPSLPLKLYILFVSFLPPAAIAIIIRRQQRTEHDANNTYLTLLLFSHILTKRYKTMLLIRRISTAHEA